MTGTMLSKYKDYLAGMAALRSHAAVPVGVVMCNDEDRALVLEEARNAGVTALEFMGHPDSVIAAMLASFQGGKGVVFSVEGALPPKLANQFHLLTKNQMDVQLSGDSERTVLSPIPDGAFVVLVMSEDTYRSFTLGDVVTSACDVTSHEVV